MYDSVVLTDLAVLVSEAAGQQVHLVLRPLREGGLECVCWGKMQFNLPKKKIKEIQLSSYFFKADIFIILILFLKYKRNL